MIEKLNEAIEKSKPVILFSKQYYEELRAREQEPTKPEQMLFDSSYLLESLLASLQSDLACPACIGRIGGVGINNTCPSCNGIGTKEAWYEKQIEELRRELDKHKVELPIIVAGNKRLKSKYEPEIPPTIEELEKILADGNPRHIRLMPDGSIRSELDEPLKVETSLAAENERLKAENLKAKLAYGLMQDIARKKQGRIELLLKRLSSQQEQIQRLEEAGSLAKDYLRDIESILLDKESCYMIQLKLEATLASVKPEQRRIKCAAIKIVPISYAGYRYRLFEGVNHSEIIKNIAEQKKGDAELPERITSDMQGFVTEFGEFVDRKEALKIAQAAGQIIHKHNPKDVLLSEDLRPLPEQEKK